MIRKSDDQLSEIDYETINLILEKSKPLGIEKLVQKKAIEYFNQFQQSVHGKESYGLVDAYRRAYDYLSKAAE